MPSGKWKSPPSDSARSAWRGARMDKLRVALVLLCAMVVVSSLAFTSTMEPRPSSGAHRLPFDGAFKSIKAKIRGLGSHKRELIEPEKVLNDVMKERDSFFEQTNPRTESVLLDNHSGVPAASPPLILAITPTYARAFQQLFFTRLVSVLHSVHPPFLWIVVESPAKTEETALALSKTAGVCLPLRSKNCRKIDYVHLSAGKEETSKWNKAVVHRNRGLDYIEEERLKGVVYFMDDDNTYFPQMFEELRKIRYVGILPVGFLFSQEYSRRNPHLHNTPMVERALVKPSWRGVPEVYGWETFEWYIPKKDRLNRKFNADMAGFGFRSEVLWMAANDDGFPKQPVRFASTHQGFLENNFLSKLVPDGKGLEPLAENGTDVWVWHMHMEQERTHAYPAGWFVEQPKELVKIANDDHSAWPFVVNKKKHGVKGRGQKGGPFIYSP